MKDRVSKAIAICPKPAEDRVAVLPDEVTDDSPSGLYVVREHEEKPSSGTVIAVGPGRITDFGIHIVADYVVGERVYHGQYAGIAITVEDTEIIFLRPQEIIAVVDEDC